MGEQPDEMKEKECRVTETDVPLINTEVSIRDQIEEDGKYILFNASNELILVINPTGKYILDNCNGELNINQIIDKVKNNFEIVEGIDIPNIVKDFVSTLLSAELVTLEAKPS